MAFHVFATSDMSATADVAAAVQEARVLAKLGPLESSGSQPEIDESM
jgi:hypothetical protein